MKIRTAVLLVPVLLVFLAGSALAKTPPKNHAGLDPSFGRKGVARTATAAPASPVHMALGPDDRVYLLQRELLLAFEADGKPARDFGNNGRVVVTATGGELRAENLTVDSQGRILVVGTVVLSPPAVDQPTSPISANEPWIGASASLQRAFVARYLDDGSRDTTFGSGGQTETTFGLPAPTGAPGRGVAYPSAIVTASTITVDPQDRPVVGGSFVTELYNCGLGPFPSGGYTARLTAGGAPDTTYASGKGYAITGQTGRITALARASDGGVDTIGQRTACGPKSWPEPGTFDALSEAGEQSPALDPARPTLFMDPFLAIDSRDRPLVVQVPEFWGPARLVRLQPSGAVDTSFGFGGGIPLGGEETYAGALAVDAKNRALIAYAGSESEAEPDVEIVRYTAAGKRDWKFGTKGLLKGGGTGDRRNSVTAMAIDGRGRIVTASAIQNSSLKTDSGIQITRFLPGG